MQTKLELLSIDLISRILDEAFELMQNPGIKIQEPEACELLIDAGADVDGDIAKIPEKVVRKALDTVPAEFWLHDRDGKPQICYGGYAVHFDPGSSGVHILDPETGVHRSSETADLVRLVKVAEMLPAYDAQSTAVVCNEVPKAIGDLYRLYIVLLYSHKPIVTGAFATKSLLSMIEMLEIFAGDSRILAEKPQAIFDVCPSPPLIWSEFGTQNLITLARRRIPVELISMPLAGAAAPVTLLGTIVQHAVESLGGIVIHQLANPGAPVVWGGAPAIFDMRHGSTPMGAIETAMIDIAYTQVGKSLSLPTHCYLGASDAKVVDAQAGLESGIGVVLGALAGVNMISGAGMLDFLACHSAEKLVLDAEAIGMAKRLIAGIELRTETLATVFFEAFNFKADFLKQNMTRELFTKEQYLPSMVIDRDSMRGWQERGEKDAFTRAKQRTQELIDIYQKPELDPKKVNTLREMVGYLARNAGIGSLPLLDE
jgi:trimethylamine--corrinoid protein Co-methyltransferase